MRIKTRMMALFFAIATLSASIVYADNDGIFVGGQDNNSSAKEQTSSPTTTSNPSNRAVADKSGSSSISASTNGAPVKVQVSAYAGDENSEKGLFATDFIVPLYYPQDKNTLVYYNPKYTYTDPEANEINQGLGIRHIFDDAYILGFNAFFDRRLSDSEKWYSQTGVGLEYLSYPLDLRLNWYKPTTGAKEIGAPYYGFGSTSLIEYDNKEEPLQGLDFEFGIPVFDKYTKTRLYLGGYFYQSRLSNDVNGFRARTETKLTDWLSIDTTFNSNINNRTEIYGGLRVAIPFDLADLFSRKNKKITSAPTPSPAAAHTYLEDRIFDRVVRDIDVQTKASTVQSTAHKMVYVDNSNTTGIQNGSLQYPYTTLQQGIANPYGYSWVYVKQGLSQDPANYYTGGSSLSNSMVLWGSGYNGGFNGLAVSGICPIINGGANGIIISNNNTVMGLQIQSTTGNGIVFTNGITLTGTIKYNYITGNGYDGIDLSGNTGRMTGFTIFGNTVTGNSNDGIDLSSNAGTMTNFTISNNTSNHNGDDGIDLQNNSGTTSGLRISGNRADYNATNGIDLYNNTGTMSGVAISGNTTDYNTVDGMTLFGNLGTMINFAIINNSSSNSVYWQGIDMGYNYGTMSHFILSGNNLSNNGFDGISAYYNYGTMSGFTISGNTANNNGTDGIDFSYNSNILSGFALTGNIANGNGAYGYSRWRYWAQGMDFSYNAGTISNLTISGNTSHGNVMDGIDLSGNNGTLNTIIIAGNEVSGNMMDGIQMSSYSSSSFSIAISGNTVSGNGGDGIGLQSDGFGTVSAAVSGNTVSDNAVSGMYLQSDNGGTMSATISGNRFTDGAGTAIYLDSGGAAFTANMSNNIITYNGYDGIFLKSAIIVPSVILSGNTLGNSIYGNDGYGVENVSGGTITAPNNWWGQVTDPSGQITGAVNYTPWLTYNPNQ